MNAIIHRTMFEHYKQWFYGICGFTFSLAITFNKSAESFAYAAIGALGAWTGTQLVKLIVKSWRKSWRPLVKNWLARK